MNGDGGHSEESVPPRPPESIDSGGGMRDERDYAKLFELLSDAILIAQDREIVFANSAAAELHGAETVEALLHLDPVELVHPDEHENLKSRRQAVMDGAKIKPVPQRRLRLDGALFVTETRGSQIVWNGRPAILIVLRDMTERERAGRELRESEQRFRELIEGFPLGIQIMALDSSRLYVNQAFLDLLGFQSKDEVYALSQIADFVEPHDRQRIDNYRRARERGEPVPSPYEYDVRRTDGTVVPVQVYTRSIVWNGVSAHQRIYLDLTERKQAEQALKASEERLQQAQKMEAVGQLTGGIAHDFNNLLTVVLGNLELLGNRLDDKKDLDILDTAMESGLRGATLTQQLLAFSRKQPLAPKVVNLNEIVTGMIDMMRRTLGETVEIDLAGESALWDCEVDPHQLENAILNLAINARDAMPTGGKLMIATANAQGGRDPDATGIDMPPGDCVSISVTDTGVGIPRDQIDHVFEPFFTTKDVGEGSGLGLSMVYGFIKQSGGHVTVDSEPGVGTVVTLYLPRAAGSRQADESVEGIGAPAAHGERILLVEDDPQVRKLIVALLGDLGYHTVETAGGTAALKALDAMPGFDMLFTDMVLPGGMSGADIARAARRRVPGIKVLFCSGYVGAARTDALMAEGGIEFIDKPFRKAELAVKLRALLDRPSA